MDREVLFAETLRRVRDIAGQQGGFIGEDRVREEFAALELGEEQLKLVFDYLVKHRIGIGEPVDPDDYLTDREKSYLQVYLDGIAALPVPGEGETEALTLAAMAGEREAAGRLAESYLRDVADIAKLYAGQGVYLEDLIGEGNVALTAGIGLLGSLEKPSEVKGMLVRMIMDAMERHIAENADSGKTDRKIADRVNAVAEKARELAGELGRKVTVRELAEESGLTEKAIRDACRMSGFKIEDIDYAEDGV